MSAIDEYAECKEEKALLAYPPLMEFWFNNYWEERNVSTHTDETDELFAKIANVLYLANPNVRDDEIEEILKCLISHEDDVQAVLRNFLVLLTGDAL